MRKQMFSRDSPRFTYFNPSLDPSVTSHAHTQLHVRLFVPLHMCRTGSETDMFKKNERAVTVVKPGYTRVVDLAVCPE